MEINVLQTLLENQDTGYFVGRTRFMGFVYFAITEEIKSIIEGETMDTITLSKFLKLGDEIIDTNIYLNDNPPFQLYQRLLSKCDHIIPVRGNQRKILADLLQGEFESLGNVQRYLESLDK